MEKQGFSKVAFQLLPDPSPGKKGDRRQRDRAASDPLNKKGGWNGREKNDF